MAWAFGASVAHTYSGGSSVETTAAISTQATGSTLVAFISCESPFTSFVDNKGNTFVLAGSAGGLAGYSGHYTRLMVCANASGGAGHTFTLTTTGTSYASILVMELTGVAAASVDVVNQVLDSASPFTVTLPTTTQANEAIVLLATMLGSGTMVAVEGTGFTKRLEVTDGSSYWPVAAFTRGVTATGDYTPSLTFSAGAPAEVMLHAIAIKEAAGGTGTTEPLTGLAATTAVGSVKANTTRVLAGQSSSSLAGTLSPLADGSAGLTGLWATMSTGDVGVAPRSVALTGASATVSAGLLTGPSGAVAVTKIATAVQWWVASNEWEPVAVSATVSGSTAIITFGSWWDDDDPAGAGGLTALPTDSNGTFTAVVNPVTAAGSPARVQIAWQQTAPAGSHSITPPELTGQGDGWFTVAEVAGINGLRDTGHVRDWHDPVFGGPDPDTIETITVTTIGSSTQAGDLLMAVLMVEPISSDNLQIQVPAGWTALEIQQAAVDNVGHLVIYRQAASSGAQSVTFNWTDDSTFVAEAAIASFEPSVLGGPLTGLNMTMAGGLLGSTAAARLTGATAAGSAGSAKALTVVTVTGAEAVIGAGSLAVGATRALTGLSASMLGGDLFTAPPTIEGLSGLQATMASGALGTLEVGVALTGHEAVLQMGTLLFGTPDAGAVLSGESMSMSQGFVFVVGDVLPSDPVRTKWRRLNPAQPRNATVLNWRGKWRSD